MINRTKLTMLVFLPLDSKGQTTMPACEGAIRFVIDRANLGGNFLAGYDIELQLENEGPAATLANYGLMKYYRQRSEETDSYMAPIIYGPTVACNTVALAAKNLHFTEYSFQCSGAFLVRQKKLYSTLYTIQLASEANVVAGLAFLKNIGNWKQIAILTNANNANEYLIAQRMQSVATSNGISVLHYANVFDINLEAAISLRNSGARVILMVLVSGPPCVRFLCYAHMAGMRPPYYVFVNLLWCVFSVESPTLVLPDGCTKQMLYEQLNIFFFAGVFGSPTNLSLPLTTIGYSLAQFEERMSTRAQSPDFSTRHLCHDAMMAAVVNLDRADKILRLSNRSLLDFQDKPEDVASVVRAVSAKTEFSGVRIGRVSFTELANVGGDDMWIAQLAKSQIRLLARLTRKDPNKSHILSFDINDYAYTERDQAAWLTKGGLAPKDLSDILHVYQYCSVNALIGVTVFAIASLLGLAFLLVRSVKEKTPYMFFKTPSKIVLMLGCCSLNAAAVLNLAGQKYFPEADCYLKVLLLSIGLSFINSVLFNESSLFLISLRGHEHAINSSNSSFALMRQRNGRSAISTRPTRGNMRKGLKRAIIGTFLLPILTAISVIAWLTGDRPGVVAAISDPYFDETRDSYVEVTRLNCLFSNLQEWSGGLLAVQTLFLLTSNFMLGSLRNLRPPTGFRHELKSVKIASLNQLVLLVTVTLIVIIVSSSSSAHCTLPVVLSIGESLYSSSVAAILMFPLKRDR